MQSASTTLPSHTASKACPLWQRVVDMGLHTVAVMGMAKNTGKTVCLNHLIRQAHADHRALGVTSIGRDGEERDEVFAIPKPPVKVTAGCWVATAKDTLLRSKVRYKLMGETGVGSPMGEIVLVKTTDAGEMEVAGASRSHDQQKVVALLKQCGADMVFLDGALGRSHHASPAMADGVVLSTGAAVGGGMDDVLRKTRDRLAILSIAPAMASLTEQVQTVFDQGGVGVWSLDGSCLFQQPIATLNASSVLSGLRVLDMATVAVSGAVGKMLWQTLLHLLNKHPGLTLVVADGTKLFVDATDVAAFEQLGGRLFAMRGIRLAGLAINPFSPYGGSFDAQTFLTRASTAFPHHRVTDVMLAQRDAVWDIPREEPWLT